LDGVERQVAVERRQVRQAQAPSPKQASAMQSENPLRFQGSWSYVITFLSRPRRSGPPPPPPRHAAHRQPRARRWPAGCSHWSLPPAQRRRARPARPRPCRPLGRRTRRHTGRARTRPRTAGRRRCAAPHLPDPTRTRAGNLQQPWQPDHPWVASRPRPQCQQCQTLRSLVGTPCLLTKLHKKRAEAW